MKIILITQGVSRVVLPLLNSRHSIVAILESAPRGYKAKTKKHDLLSKVTSLRSFFKLTPVSLKVLCKRKKIPYLFMTSSSDAGLENWIKSVSPAVIVVSSMSQLLKPNIFSIPMHGTINLHPSFLPEYRGPNPDFWQYHDQILNPGVTVHYVDDGEDTGDLICQERVSIPLGIKSPTRLDQLIGGVGVRLLLDALDQIESGSVVRKAQPKNSPTVRARNIKRDEHSKIIDWSNWPIERIWHLMRGTELWLDCVEQPKGLYSGQRWLVGNYQKNERKFPTQTLGKVMRDNDGYFVCCREGQIRLQKSLILKSLLRTAYRFMFN